MLPEPEVETNSFYESFSDLIFATMAIFVLMFSMILLLVRPEPEKVEPKTLDLVVAIDGSGSMGPEMSELRQALVLVNNRIAPIADILRIGIIVYRDADTTTAFPSMSGDACDAIIDPDNRELALITRPAVDKGFSNECLLDFLNDDLVAIDGPADLATGAEIAIRIMSDIKNSSQTRTLIIIGDVGPYEVPTVVATFGEMDEREQQLLGQLQRFSESYPDVKVLSLFSGKEPPYQQNEAYSKKNWEFWQSISEFTNGTYLRGSSDLVLQLLLAVLPEEVE